MTAQEYFGEWSKVIPFNHLNQIMRQIVRCSDLCPTIDKVFKAFELCRYYDCKAIIVGQDPYPQKGVSTGIAFGNNETDEEKLSPSLKVIKECVIDFEVLHNIINFDNSLESWCRQGVLLLNSALTCRINNIGCHVNLWRPFIAEFLRNFSLRNPGVVYLLLGEQARTFKPYIKSEVIECKHPSYYARTRTLMPKVFNQINRLLKDKYNETINWYEEH